MKYTGVFKPARNTLDIKRQLTYAGVVFLSVVSVGVLLFYPNRVYRIFGILIVLFIFVTGFKNVKVPLFAFIAYMPFNIMFNRELRGEHMTGNSIVNILLVIIAVTWTLHLITNKRVRLRSPVTVPLVLFLIGTVFSLMYGIANSGSSYTIENAVRWKQWISPMILFFLVINCIKDIKDVKIITYLMTFAFIIAALLSIRDYLSLGYDADVRIGGLMGSPNDMGEFLAQYSFIFLGFVLLGGQRTLPKRLMFLAAGVLGAIAMLYTFSRGAYFAFAITFLVFALVKSRILFIFVLVLLIFGQSLLPGAVRHRIDMTVVESEGGVELESSAASRLEIWGGALRMIADYPITGIGYTRFPIVINDYISLEGKSAHNMYLLIAAEMGLIGLGLFLWLLFRMFKTALHVYRNTESDFIRGLAFGYLFCFLCLILGNLFGTRFVRAELTTFFWALTGIMIWARAGLDQKQAATAQMMGI